MPLLIKHLLIYSGLVLLCVSGHPFAATAQSPLKLAPLPMLAEHRIKNQFSPFADYLSQLTRRPVTLVYQENYTALRDQWQHDQIDLAYLGPLPYVLLSDQDPDVVPLVRFYNNDGTSTYTCCLAVYSGDGIDLQQDTTYQVALTQPYSSCGYLLTEYLLNRHDQSLKDYNYSYSGSQSETALNTLRGNTHISGVKTSIADNYRHLGLMRLEESMPLPGFVLVANSRTVDTDTINRIQQQLLALDPQHQAADRAITSPWGASIRNGAMVVKPGDYDIIRQLLSTIAIPDLAP